MMDLNNIISFQKIMPAAQGLLQKNAWIRGLPRVIRAASDTLDKCSDAELRGRTEDLSGLIHPTRPVHSEAILVPGIALIHQALKRTNGISLYDVQLLGGVVMALGMIAEMQTGEGKTYTASIPAFLHALKRKGVHVATSNAYLAERDRELIAPAFDLLGMRVAILPEKQDTVAKKAAYAAEVTYGTGYEFGFDYLRDQLIVRKNLEQPLGSKFRSLVIGNNAPQDTAIVQRNLAFAIVDEIDHVLLDDASSPLCISQSTQEAATDAIAIQAACDLVNEFQIEHDFALNARNGTTRLTDQGRAKANSAFLNRQQPIMLRSWNEYVEQAIKARFVMQRNKQYVVNEAGIQIVDESTGRIFENRSWRDGLNQAVEAKEKIKITSEASTLARISRQRFYRLYEGLCGMTGTADSSQTIFRDLYGLEIFTIPQHRKSRRELLPTLVFPSRDAKWRGIAHEVQQLKNTGRPILVGTRSISDSQTLAEQLSHIGLDIQLLNGCQDADEAAIIGEAGKWQAITIATQMAGRGTDIRLSPETHAAGGLHVIVVEHHDSVGHDRQLIGRAGRQGDPGSARVYISGEDQLATQHSDWLSTCLKRLVNEYGEQRPGVVQRIRRTQRKLQVAQDRMLRQMLSFDLKRDTLMEQLARHA